jgi:hypothetical protein
MTEKELMEEQKSFVLFLKENNLYDPMESAHTMCKMHRVWKIMKEEIDDIYIDMAGEDI